MKKTKPWKKLIPILVLLFVLGTGSGVLLAKFGGNDAEVTTVPPTQLATPSTSSTPISLGTATARMMCAGDNLIHNSIYQQAKARATDGGYDFGFAYEKVKDILALPDFAVLNQETVLSSSSEPSSYPLFNSPQSLGDCMVGLGFKVMNHANNHVLDKGATGAVETINYWKSKQGVVLTGLYSDDNDMNEVKLNTVNGITFSHVGFTEYLNGLSIPSDSTLRVVSPVGAGMTEEEFYATMKTMVEKAKAASDVVCVSMHFQQENSATPSESQEKIIAALVEYGADIIIGTGPHVLQPIKYIDRTDGSRALVMYSLGNFISAQDGAANMVSGIADISVEKNLDTGAVSIKKAGLIPIVTQYGSGFSDIHIEPFYSYSEVLANEHGVKSSDSQFGFSYVQNLLNTVIGSEFIIDKPSSEGVTAPSTEPQQPNVQVSEPDVSALSAA